MNASIAWAVVKHCALRVELVKHSRKEKAAIEASVKCAELFLVIRFDRDPAQNLLPGGRRLPAQRGKITARQFLLQVPPRLLDADERGRDANLDGWRFHRELHERPRPVPAGPEPIQGGPVDKCSGALDGLAELHDVMAGEVRGSSAGIPARQSHNPPILRENGCLRLPLLGLKNLAARAA